MKRGRWAGQPGLLRQYSRLNVIRVGTLEALGMESSSVYRRCLPGGPWRRLLPGIILMQDTPPTADQRVVAAVLYAGARALITGAEACRRHGLRSDALPGGDGIQVLIPHDIKVISSEFVTVERTIRLPEEMRRHGVPLAPLVRAVTDTARRIRAVEPVRALLIEAIQRGRCSPADLLFELDRGSQRGTAVPRRQLGELGDVRSQAEFAAKLLSRRLTIQPTHRNVPVYGPDGAYIACPDAWWDDIALAWEIDSVQFHFSKEDYARTLERNSRYAGAGIVVVQTLPAQVRDRPDAVIAEIEAALRAAAARPRPPVRLGQQAA